MKRSKSENNNGSFDSGSNGNLVYRSHEMNGSRSPVSRKVNFDFDENDNTPPPIAPRSGVKKIAPPVPTERRLTSGERMMLGGDPNENQFGTYVQEEIHPGVVLEGYAVEL